MNIVIATDNNFVQHCVSTLNSLLINNKIGMHIYLLSEGLTEENLVIIENVIKDRRSFLHYVLVDKKLVTNLPMPQMDCLSHISIATYYRLLIPILLPKSVTKVIYLDCDVIIRKSISELWETNIENNAIGAVYQMVSWTIDDVKRLKYPLEYGYFNAGVLLINVEYWRENLITDKLLNYIKLNYNEIIYHDQDALNAVLYDKCIKLPCKWNLLSIFFKKDIINITDINDGQIINDYADYKKELVSEPYDPTIIHFVSKPKPWNAKCTHPFRKEYYKYLRNTPWENFKEPKPIMSFLYRISRRIKYFILFRKYPDII